MSLPIIKFLHFSFFAIQPGQFFSRQVPDRQPAHPDTMGESNTPTSLKACGIKIMAIVGLTLTFMEFYGALYWSDKIIIIIFFFFFFFGGGEGVVYEDMSLSEYGDGAVILF